jgi:AcrR family transcriptional regulator
MRTRGSSKEETGKRVIAAAVRTFARHGYAASGIRQLAEEAALTPGALYHHMDSKQDLLVAVMRSAMEPLLAATDLAVRGAASPEEALVTLVELHVWSHGTQPDAMTVTDTEVRALGEHARRDVMVLRDRYQHAWRAVVVEGADAGVFTVEDAGIATIALLGLCSQVSQWYSADGPLSLEQICAMHADLALGLVRARHGTAPVRRAGLQTRSPADLLGEAAR